MTINEGFKNQQTDMNRQQREIAQLRRVRDAAVRLVDAIKAYQAHPSTLNQAVMKQREREFEVLV